MEAAIGTGRPTGWASTEESPKAWMSVRDADLLESFLLRLARLRDGAPLRVLEWGCGRSTLWYGRLLDGFGIPHTWLGVEHDRRYFESEIARAFVAEPGTRVVVADNETGAPPHRWSGGTERVVVLFDHGPVAPFETRHPADRLIDMDRYVGLPAAWNYACDIAIVDGRKRRRCVLEARRLIGADGFVLLHDAGRTPYRSAWEAFGSHCRIGDDWWIGSNRPRDLTTLLPWHAFDAPAQAL